LNEDSIMKTRTRKEKTSKAGTQTNPTRRLPPTREQIRGRAYQIHLARGGANGRELDDWLQAERELIADFPGVERKHE
jgi:hypothetical protein